MMHGRMILNPNHSAISRRAAGCLSLTTWLGFVKIAACQPIAETLCPPPNVLVSHAFAHPAPGSQSGHDFHRDAPSSTAHGFT
jgi:hypothetical protein